MTKWDLSQECKLGSTHNNLLVLTVSVPIAAIINYHKLTSLKTTQIVRIFKYLSLPLFIITTPSLTLILLCSVRSDSLQSYGLWPARLLLPWGFSRQEYWSVLPCPLPGGVSDPGVKPVSPAVQVASLPAELPGKSLILLLCFYKDLWDYINFTQII